MAALIRDHHWLPAAQRIKFKILLIVANCIHQRAPTYLQKLCVPASTVVGRRNLRSADQFCLVIPRCQSTSMQVGSRCPYFTKVIGSFIGQCRPSQYFRGETTYKPGTMENKPLIDCSIDRLIDSEVNISFNADAGRPNELRDLFCSHSVTT